jgi:hypothetical protein
LEGIGWVRAYIISRFEKVFDHLEEEFIEVSKRADAEIRRQEGLEFGRY